MNTTHSIHRTRVVVAGAVLAAGVGAGLFVPGLIDAGADEARTPVTTPDNAGVQRAGTITAAYVGPAELVFVPQDGTEAVSLPVSGDVVVTTIDGSRIDYGRFTRVVQADPGSQYEIEVEDGFVVTIDEVER